LPEKHVLALRAFLRLFVAIPRLIFAPLGFNPRYRYSQGASRLAFGVWRLAFVLVLEGVVISEMAELRESAGSEL
jgi:hypothetical protein